MSIIKQSTQEVVLDNIYVDVNANAVTAYFSRFVDGEKVESDIIFTVDPTIINGTIPSITTAIYNYAIQQGWFSGTVQ